jgi:RNA polymerase sigma-70 factor (ECF subfamily)
MVSKTVGNCVLLREIFDHEPTPIDTEKFARLFEESPRGADESRQARLDGAQVHAERSIADSPWADYAASRADITALHQPIASLVEVKDFTRLLPGKSEFNSAMEDDLNVLAGAAVGGKRDAVEGVLRRIRPLVVRYCRARIGGEEKTFSSADDVAQEVCLAVLRALPRYRDQGRPFLAFVYGIAAHKVADARRSSARNRAEPMSEIPDSQALDDGPEAHVIQGEFAGRMAKLLDTLPEKQREIIRLRVMVGLSAEETAEAVGSTPGAVRVAQHRALNKLRNVLASTP